jgi:iron complex transport system substrate-binding protein
MKWLAAAVLVLMIGPAAAAPASVDGTHPRAGRIMSLKICTDALLLDLVSPSRIASVTFLAREKAALRWWPQAAHIPVNHNTAEEILAAKPDLILTDTFTAPALRPLLAKTGAKVIEVPPAGNFDQIRAVTRMVAKAVGEEARGEQLIARMDADLKTLAARRPARPLNVAEWGGGGYVPGRGGLFDAVLTAVGARNIEQGAFGYYDVETLVAKNPDALIYGDTYAGTASLRDDQNLHPALLKRYANRRVSYDPLYGCGVPQTARAALALQAALARVSR